MNFLAHLLLSGNNEQIMLGNFMGDFIKSKQLGKLPPEIVKGVELHWEIDHFTDSHPVVSASKARLRSKYGHYAAVIIDIFYDHFLAINWEKYSALDLRVFVDDAYSILNKNLPILPKKAQHMLPFMIQYDWLYNYQYFEGIERVMQGMSRRASFRSRMEESIDDLKHFHDLFNNEFNRFFPELMHFCSKWIQRNL